MCRPEIRFRPSQPCVDTPTAPQTTPSAAAELRLWGKWRELLHCIFSSATHLPHLLIFSHSCKLKLSPRKQTSLESSKETYCAGPDTATIQTRSSNLNRNCIPRESASTSPYSNIIPRMACRWYSEAQPVSYPLPSAEPETAQSLALREAGIEVRDFTYAPPPKEHIEAPQSMPEAVNENQVRAPKPGPTTAEASQDSLSAALMASRGRTENRQAQSSEQTRVAQSEEPRLKRKVTRRKEARLAWSSHALVTQSSSGTVASMDNSISQPSSAINHTSSDSDTFAVPLKKRGHKLRLRTLSPASVSQQKDKARRSGSSRQRPRKQPRKRPGQPEPGSSDEGCEPSRERVRQGRLPPWLKKRRSSQSSSYGADDEAESTKADSISSSQTASPFLTTTAITTRKVCQAHSNHKVPQHRKSVESRADSKSDLDDETSSPKSSTATTILAQSQTDEEADNTRWSDLRRSWNESSDSGYTSPDCDIETGLHFGDGHGPVRAGYGTIMTTNQTVLAKRPVLKSWDFWLNLVWFLLFLALFVGWWFGKWD